LGLLKYAPAVGPLIQQFNQEWANSANYMLSGAVLDSLAKIASDDAVDFLLSKVLTPLVAPNPSDQLQVDNVASLNKRAMFALGSAKSPRVVAALSAWVAVTQYPDEEILLAVALSSAEIHDSASIRALLGLLTHQSQDVRSWAAQD